MPSSDGRSDTARVAIFEIVTRDAESSEFVSDLLWQAGVQGIEELPSDDGSVTLRSSFGITIDQTNDRLKALLSTDAAPHCEAAVGEFPPQWRVEWVDATVADSWKNFARVVEVSETLCIAPAWLQEQGRSKNRCSTTVVIDPGPTFGMGDHPTTMGSLQLLERHVTRDVSILDVGCGSGILGISCLVLGADRAVGIDIAPACIAVSQVNAAANGVEPRWSVSTDSLDSLPGPFDLIAANILAPVLVSLAPDLIRLLGDQGVLVISGILDGRYEHVLEALSPLSVVDTVIIGGWASLALARTPQASSVDE